MKTAVLMPEGFDNYLTIQNARQRFEEARDISRKLLEGGIALKANADHYAIFSDPPRLLAGPLKQAGYAGRHLAHYRHPPAGVRVAGVARGQECRGARQTLQASRSRNSPSW
ncbi:MAG: hypothetical protein ACRD2L_16425 [Terriglobia bacterium]